MYEDDADDISIQNAAQQIHDSVLPEEDPTVGLRDSTKIIYSERADHNNIQTVEANANDFLPSSRLSCFMRRIYLIKTLPPYTSIPAESKSPLLPPMRDKKRFTLVVLRCVCDAQILDLDETIVHCAMQP